MTYIIQMFGALLHTVGAVLFIGGIFFGPPFLMAADISSSVTANQKTQTALRARYPLMVIGSVLVGLALVTLGAWMQDI